MAIRRLHYMQAKKKTETLRQETDMSQGAAHEEAISRARLRPDEYEGEVGLTL